MVEDAEYVQKRSSKRTWWHAENGMGPYCFVDVKRGKEIKRGNSWSNPTEALAIASIVEMMLKGGGQDQDQDEEDAKNRTSSVKEEEIGVISFYSGQASLIPNPSPNPNPNPNPNWGGQSH